MKYGVIDLAESPGIHKGYVRTMMDHDGSSPEGISVLLLALQIPTTNHDPISKVKDVVARAVALHAIRYSFNTGDVFVPKVQASEPEISADTGCHQESMRNAEKHSSKFKHWKS